MIRVHASNRMETLAEWLAEDMRREPADPIDPERIVVPHRLLGEWLRLELAARLGIAAHFKIELPAEFAWSVMREAVPDLPVESSFEPGALRWRIFDLLGRWTGDDPIDRYLADGDSRKRFELADKLALAYDRCLVFRNGEWNAGDPSAWHVRLWDALLRDMGAATHWVDAVAAYGRAIGQASGPGGPTARRPKVRLFGIAMLSPSYLEMLRHIDAAMDIDLFLLSPSHDLRADDRPTADDGAERNELVATWGRLAHDMQALLAERLSTETGRQSHGGAPETCLGEVQRDILEGRSATAAPDSESAARIGRDDTIQIHVCHSPTREVEVLHDRLLGLFHDHPNIQPADVLVLSPELDAYAPVIEAVFGAAEEIPFNIGRQRGRVGTAINAFLDLLALAGSRYTASELLAPLRAASVRHRFGLDDGDLARIRDWVGRAGVRWGMDAAHRTEEGIAAPAHNNWHHGLRRLLLAYAIPDDDALVDGVVPCPLDRRGYQSGAGDYERLGSFARYCDLARELNGWIADELTPGDWAQRLRADVLGRFFVRPPYFDPESGREIDAVARLIDDFAGECEVAEADIPVPFEVLRDALVSRAGVEARAVPRLADGVTVASLATGQVFPAKVVCVIGMNDGAFPRLPSPAIFDFMEQLFDEDSRQPGDRDARDEDRFAFLEALLAARRCFLVSYTGRDLMEDKPIPPSVAVSELTDYLRRRFPAADGWETRHPLQPFSRRYFTPTEPHLFSYSQAMANAARSVERIPEPPARFVGKLPAARERPAVPSDEIQLEDLIRFSASPTKYFLRNRLGLYLDVYDDEIGDDEPFELNPLEAWQLKSDMFERQQNGTTSNHRLLAATGQLPRENLGRIQYRETAQEVADIAAALEPYKDHCEEVAVDIAVDGFRIVGSVPGLHRDEGEFLWWRIGDIRSKDKVEAWLRLLALTCAVERCVSARMLGSKTHAPLVVNGPAPEQARSHLRRWLKAWTDGQREPLPFFPHTSMTWVTHPSRAEAAWWQSYDDGNDDYHRMVFADAPITEAFRSLASDLLEPLDEAMQ